MTHTDKSW